MIVYHCNNCKKWFCRNAIIWHHTGPFTPTCDHCDSTDHTHTATVDPAVIIARFLNGDQDVMKDLTGEKPVSG